MSGCILFLAITPFVAWGLSVIKCAGVHFLCIFCMPIQHLLNPNAYIFNQAMVPTVKPHQQHSYQPNIFLNMHPTNMPTVSYPINSSNFIHNIIQAKFESSRVLILACVKKIWLILVRAGLCLFYKLYLLQEHSSWVCYQNHTKNIHRFLWGNGWTLQHNCYLRLVMCVRSL